MITIKQAILPIIKSGTSKYRLSKDLGVQPIMIDHYLTGNVKSPKFSVCKAIYDKYNVVTFPYTEEELQSKHEQLLMEFDDDNSSNE